MVFIYTHILCFWRVVYRWYLYIYIPTYYVSYGLCMDGIYIYPHIMFLTGCVYMVSIYTHILCFWRVVYRWYLYIHTYYEICWMTYTRTCICLGDRMECPIIESIYLRWLSEFVWETVTIWQGKSSLRVKKSLCFVCGNFKCKYRWTLLRHNISQS